MKVFFPLMNMYIRRIINKGKCTQSNCSEWSNVSYVCRINVDK